MTDADSLIYAIYTLDRHVLWLCGLVLARIFFACWKR